jgi:hypothetical protein
VKPDAELPGDIYTSKFNRDSLLLIREKYYALLYDISLSDETFKEYKHYVSSRLAAYTRSIKAEKKFLYYIKAPLRLTKIFFIHSGTYNLFAKSSAELNPLEYFFKLFYSAFYLAVMVLGFIGLILLLKQSLRAENCTLITGIVLYTTVIHPIVLRLCEARYFVPAWPFLIVCAAYTICFSTVKSGRSE